MTWTYSDLVTKVGGYLSRTDLSSQIDDAILLFESDYNTRKSVWRRQSVTTLTSTSGTSTVNLPTDFERMVAIDRVGYDSIRVTSLDGIKPYRIAPDAPYAEPRYAAIYPDNKLLLAPTPDAAYSYELVYNPRLSGLTSTNTTNWLIEKYPHVYLYGVLSYMLDYVRDEERAAYIRQRHESNMLLLESAASVLPEQGAVMSAAEVMP
jgi:hypothetical protein